MEEYEINSPKDLRNALMQAKEKRRVYAATVAKEVGISKHWIGSFFSEAGNPTVNTLLAICRKLNIDVIFRVKDIPYERPILREFPCRMCGRTITVTDELDRREVFCSHECEKKYWRHEYTRRNETKNGRESQGMSSGMSLRNLIRREKRDLL